MICGGVEVVCCGEVDGHNPCMWHWSILSDSWGGGSYPCLMTWSSLNMSHDNLSCGVCKNVIVTWNNFACLSLYSSVWSLTWCGNFCAVWVGGTLLGFPKEVPCVDNPLQCNHTHHI